jgi:hypothetical protein
MRDSPEDNGLYCFIDATRPCDAACMAYQTYVPGDKMPELGSQQQQCLLLCATHRLSKHVTVIAKILNDERSKKSMPGADPMAGLGRTPR